MSIPDAMKGWLNPRTVTPKLSGESYIGIGSYGFSKHIELTSE